MKTVVERVRDVIAQGELDGRPISKIYLGKSEYTAYNREMFADPRRIVISGTSAGSPSLCLITVDGSVNLIPTDAESEFRTE